MGAVGGKNPTLRQTKDLCEEENNFLKNRREKVFEAMQEILGKKGPTCIEEVPTVSVIGSGGGIRAVVGLHGVTKALVDSRILNCTTYLGGLSGSSWYISTLCSHPKWPNMHPVDMQDELKNNTSATPLWKRILETCWIHLAEMLRKYGSGQPISLVDVWGYNIGDMLLKGRMDSKLSDQRKKVEKGQAPLPLLTCICVKEHVPERFFNEWVEFSPFEIGIAEYGIFMKTEHFGSTFNEGNLQKKFNEPPLHFLQGIWGSAFGLFLKRHMTLNEFLKFLEETFEKDDEEYDRNEMIEFYNNREADYETQNKGFWKRFKNRLFEIFSPVWEFLISRAGRSGVIHNFVRGLNYPTNSKYKYPTNSKYLYLVDAGLACNSPYPLVLRQQRKVDIILSFDFSQRKSDSTQPFKQLLKARDWANEHSLPFPPINVPEPDKEVKEVYIFKDTANPDCPMILHFPLVNKKFRKFIKPDVPRNTEEERAFADFNIFDGPTKPYSTFNFQYSSSDFERLTKLTEFNTLLNVAKIKKIFAESIKNKRSLAMKDVQKQ